MSPGPPGASDAADDRPDGPNQPATVRYELIVDRAEVGGRTGGVVGRVLGLLGRPRETAGLRVFSLRERSTGRPVMRHIEDWDDDDHLYDRIAADLASLSVDEFAARWD